MKNYFLLLISTYVSPSVKATEKASIDRPMPNKIIESKILQVIYIIIPLTLEKLRGICLIS